MDKPACGRDVRFAGIDPTCAERDRNWRAGKARVPKNLRGTVRRWQCPACMGWRPSLGANPAHTRPALPLKRFQFSA